MTATSKRTPVEAELLRRTVIDLKLKPLRQFGQPNSLLQAGKTISLAKVDLILLMEAFLKPYCKKKREDNSEIASENVLL